MSWRPFDWSLQSLTTNSQPFHPFHLSPPYQWTSFAFSGLCPSSQSCPPRLWHPFSLSLPDFLPCPDPFHLPCQSPVFSPGTLTCYVWNIEQLNTDKHFADCVGIEISSFHRTRQRAYLVFRAHSVKILVVTQNYADTTSFQIKDCQIALMHTFYSTWFWNQLTCFSWSFQPGAGSWKNTSWPASLCYG